jgi:chromosome segregation ATPase
LVAAWLLLHPLPRAGAADPPPPTETPALPADQEGPPSSTEARLREYEIRLSAHRRELMEREAALEAARRRIEELTRAQATAPKTIPARGPTPRLPSEPAVGAPAPLPPPSPSPSSPEKASEQQDAVASLRQELDAERENRATLEKEIQRLLADAHSSEHAEALAGSFESARAEILLLNHRLADEQKARESLEVAIERVRTSAGISPGQDWIDRFESTMRERREQAERLERELREANEAIVALRGKLEATVPGAAVDPAALRQLETENGRLRQALEGAQEANSALRAKAELASHLAELLYAQPR